MIQMVANHVLRSPLFRSEEERGREHGLGTWPLWWAAAGLLCSNGPGGIRGWRGHFSPSSKLKLTQQLRVGAEQELVEDVIVALAAREPRHAGLQRE